MHKRNIHGSGFTIVELLIVIVVIAILAAISVVAYTNFQQRATNSAVKQTAAETLRLVQAYVATNDKYPIGQGRACVTEESGCADANSGAPYTYSQNDILKSNLSEIGTASKTVPKVHTDRNGIYLTYASGVTYQGIPSPMLMTYYLSGVNQDCGLSRVVNYTWPNLTPSSTGFTIGDTNGLGVTRCWISVPGPSA